METQKDIDAKLKLRLWFEASNGTSLGMGRIMILKKVVELGSLQKAARELGISYSRARAKITKTEQMLGVPLLDKRRGPQGCQPTTMGKELIQKFDEWQQEVKDFALEKCRSSFPWNID